MGRLVEVLWTPFRNLFGDRPPFRPKTVNLEGILFVSSKCKFWNATKTVELRIKYINRKLVIVRVVLNMFNFFLVVVIMFI